ncbi:hypothetical protein [Thalassorhabdomicrobium marinisediminis]|nr:hypothetical protein [Thalassorhabdomicrobium marinisediminis]
MIADGKFSAQDLHDLTAFMNELQARSNAVDYEVVLVATENRSDYQIARLRRTTWMLFEAHPILRALDRVIASRKPSVRKKYKPRERKFSVFFEELPQDWQDSFARMDAGQPGKYGTVPVPSMAATMKTKACEFIKAAQVAGSPEAMCIASATSYERSLIAREKPLSRKTMLSSVRQIRDFARYLGSEEAVLDHLADRIRVHENRSQHYTPVKQAAINLIPEYSEIFGMALDMLSKASHTQNPRSAQSYRNKAVAITLFCPFPLRVSDTRLRFGEEILWDGRQYQFDLTISKTGRAYRPYILPVFGFFIDQLILQGCSTEYLDALRTECLEKRRPLFVNYDDTEPHPRYVSYAWASVFGTGSHIARTHLHNTFGRLGARGVELAMLA